jgi:hypothetical protein
MVFSRFLSMTIFIPAENTWAEPCFVWHFDENFIHPKLSFVKKNSQSIVGDHFNPQRIT